MINNWGRKTKTRDAIVPGLENYHWKSFTNVTACSPTPSFIKAHQTISQELDQIQIYNYKAQILCFIQVFLL